MKPSKLGAAFLTKFSAFIAKFKESSTINVAHEQIRKLFSEYKFAEIAIPFASKMDSIEQLSEKEKKQYIKIYISLIDCYGQDIVLDHYDRIIDSVARKGAGVHEVVGHLCRALLKRIYPTENIGNYIKHLLGAFQRHTELAKIIKQIVESFDAEIMAPFQSQILGIIAEKMSLNIKGQAKQQYLEAVLALVLSLQARLYEQQAVQQLVYRNFKNDQWGVRKVCVDISYALLVINKEINQLLHDSVIELKYDKIKHVRDSVNNYTTLHRQIYGDTKDREQKEKAGSEKFATFRNPLQKDAKRPYASKSPAIGAMQHEEVGDKKPEKSLDKSIKSASRNEQFFQNARNKDVIKVAESKSMVFDSKNLEQNKGKKTLSNNYLINEKPTLIASPSTQNLIAEGNQSINFEQYLKNRPSATSYFNFSPSLDKSPEITKQKVPGKPKQVTLSNSKSNPSLQQQKGNNQQLSLLQKQFEGFQEQFFSFSNTVIGKIERLEARVAKLEAPRHKQQDQSMVSLQKDLKQIKNQLHLQQEFERKFNQIDPSKLATRYQASESSEMFESQRYREITASTQSRVEEKIGQSLRMQNWNEAFSLALANNNKSSLIQLLKMEKIPSDRLVQDCLLTELRRNLGSCTVLKWLNKFIYQVQIPEDKLAKLYSELKKSFVQLEDHLNYQHQLEAYNTLKNSLMSQIKPKLDSSAAEYTDRLSGDHGRLSNMF